VSEEEKVSEAKTSSSVFQMRVLLIKLVYLYKQEQEFILELFHKHTNTIKTAQKYFWFDCLSDVYFDQVIKIVSNYFNILATKWGDGGYLQTVQKWFSKYWTPEVNQQIDKLKRYQE